MLRPGCLTADRIPSRAIGSSPIMRRDLVLDATADPKRERASVLAPLALDLGALTALTRLEVLGYDIACPHAMQREGELPGYCRLPAWATCVRLLRGMSFMMLRLFHRLRTGDDIIDVSSMPVNDGATRSRPMAMPLQGITSQVVSWHRRPSASTLAGQPAGAARGCCLCPAVAARLPPNQVPAAAALVWRFLAGLLRVCTALQGRRFLRGLMSVRVVVPASTELMRVQPERRLVGHFPNSLKTVLLHSGAERPILEVLAPVIVWDYGEPLGGGGPFADRTQGTHCLLCQQSCPALHCTTATVLLPN